ncbi:MAG: hypothetical protein FGM14_16665 [Flavobacteriales bacterium]|nr:hypothetical protein [Flavobacteriales bacterium]
MENLIFKISISATAEKVWDSLWEIENYKKWTSVFCDGSYYKTNDFSQGNKIHLLAPNGGGMYSILEKIVENETLVFKHLGELKNFEEQPNDEATQGWSNALESYELKQKGNEIELTVQVETVEEYVAHMNKTFPLALQELKNISEN